MTTPTDPTLDPAPATGTDPQAEVPAADHRGWSVLLAAVVVVALLALAVRLAEPSEPGAFYDPPTAREDAAPGTVLRAEALETAPAGARGWRVLYRSTTRDGAPTAVSGVVFAPAGDAPPGSRRVIAWAHPTTGVDRRCAPSIGADGGAGAIPGLATFLAAGYVVTATDYPGLGTPGPHPYLVGASEAPAVLDSVRAAARLDGAGAGRSVALWGHSQGGHAALFAAQAAPDYAPELELVGVATAAPATQLAELLRRDVGGATGNVLASMALVSWSAVYADHGLSLEGIVEREAIPIVRLVADGCIETTAQELVDLPEAELLRIGFLERDPWAIPPWDDLLAENSPGSAARDLPLLVAQGSSDTVVWPGVTEAWVAARCADGIVVEERVYEGFTHTEIARAAADDVHRWVDARFEGRAAPSTCGGPGT